MKVVIIGGGIAGLTLGILLQRRKIEVVINEKWNGIQDKGHAFLMSDDGYSILKNFIPYSKEELLSKKVNRFSLKRKDQEELIKIQLNGWHCMKRKNLISFLNASLDKDILQTGRSFSHFIFEKEKAIAAVFENGDVEYGDVFIGADGSASSVRDAIFGKVNFSNTEVKEVVGISAIQSLASQDASVFQKYQSKSKGLAFGFIPVSSDEVVWFMQYDATFSDGSEELSPQHLSSFCKEILKEFPCEVKDILEANDFSKSYVWKTRDFDVLPSFHQNNIALIGDAAHLALPFTSAGTTNAILDANVLALLFEQFNDFEIIFTKYYNNRALPLASQIEQGRELKKLFLNPKMHSERGYILPLISDQKEHNVTEVIKPLKVLYFTDPICSTCWVIQPILRKLKLEYDEYLDIDYHMGGLLPSWIEYDKGIIKNPMDAAIHWEEVSKKYDIPLDGDIWIEDPLHSSFPPSIAFKAAQLQNKGKAIVFLRRLKEMAFVEKKNITRWELIEEAALGCGLDTAILKKDIAGKGKDMFQEDLRLTKENKITTFPTFLFLDGDETRFTLKGIQAYSKFEEIIHQLIPHAVKKEKTILAIELFEKFNIMTTNEFAFLYEVSNEISELILSELFEKGFLKKIKNKNGLLWIHKQDD